ncbi:type II 3-dehydroquinate dehydratase [Thalassospira sp. SM2505]|uniref:type II 3-dehydroquinate dehydratase n=1 Tax=Thalassospira TaxID=168934 RepID=UPI000DEDBD36|nr:type II 3-dehydroquinate dehydratase [Thalassospira profundimaris]
MTLHVINDRCEVNDTAERLRAICHEDNKEGELVDWFQETRQEESGILCNAGAYTHTSVAILDAIGASDMPMIEVHLSNIQKRDAFRLEANVSKAANGMIYGFGSQSYKHALDAMRELIHTPS